MKTSAKVFLLVVVTLGVAAGTVHLFAPALIPSLVARVRDSAQPAPSVATPPTAPLGGPSAPGDSGLGAAQDAYDAGDFVPAMDLYFSARADRRPDVRERAGRGLRKTVLAWALTSGTPALDPMPPEPEGELARRQALAEAEPSERGWYDLTLFAAGTGFGGKLPFLAVQAINCAQPGGPVEARLQKALVHAGPRGDILRDAMTAQGFALGEDPIDPVAAAAAPRVTPKYTGSSAIAVPGGTFKAATKVRLAQAVVLEKKGAEEYDLSGPDSPKRKEHRKAAIDLLMQARNIYQEAEEEDMDSTALSMRLRAVMEMLSHLKKESALGE